MVQDEAFSALRQNESSKPTPWQTATSAEILGSKGAGKGDRDQMMHRQHRQNDVVQEVDMKIRNFCEDLSNQIRDQKPDSLGEMYMRDYPQYCDQLMKKNLGRSLKWPDLENVKQFLGDEHGVHLLYKELTIRHVFARLDKHVTVQDRMQSWSNYMDIFDRLDKDMSTPAGPNSKSLLASFPNAWLWDLVDEFVYQYQQFCVYKNKVQAKPEEFQEDMSLLDQNPAVWHGGEVYNRIKQLADAGVNPVLTGDDKGASQAAYLCYFARIQQARYEIMFGQYKASLSLLDTLDVCTPTSLCYAAPQCHMSVHFYLGFNLMMLGRFSDAMMVFSKALQFVLKLHRYPQLLEYYTPTIKVQEKMWRLLALCDVLSPDKYHFELDQQLSHIIQDRFSEDLKILRTYGSKDSNESTAGTSGEKVIAAQPFKTKVIEWFMYNCPKFVTSEGESDKAHALQVEHFWHLIEEQKEVPLIRSYLRMYSNLKLEKMQVLSQSSSPEALRQKLALVKSRRDQPVMGPNGKFLPGLPQRCTDLDFEIDETNGLIKVEIEKRARNFTGKYMRDIESFKEIQKMTAKMVTSR